MNGDSVEMAPWSWRRWALVVGLLLALQTGAVWLLSARSRPAQRQPEGAFAARWLTAPNSARVVEAMLLNDPAHLAAVNPSGFSGAAWLRPTPPAYQPAEWREAERSPAQPTQSLGAAFPPAPRGAAGTVFESARKSPAPPPATVGQAPLRSTSRLLVEGPLRARALVEQPPLRSWAHGDVLADTRVQVSISAEGLVLPPRLLPSDSAKDPAQRAAQRAADLHALEFARALRFAPVPGSAGARAATPSEGVLVFQWHTLAPPAPKQE